MLGHITEAQAGSIAEAIGALESNKLTSAFRRIGVFSSSEGRRELHPLLNPDEEIANTCFDGAYYTFATDRASADRMFADNAPIKDLIACIAANPESEAVADLTIVRGRKLVFLELERIGDVTIEKKAYVQRNWHLPLVSVKEIKATALGDTRKSLDGFFGSYHLGAFQSRVRDVVLEQVGVAIEHL